MNNSAASEISVQVSDTEVAPAATSIAIPTNFVQRQEPVARTNFWELDSYLLKFLFFFPRRLVVGTNFVQDNGGAAPLSMIAHLPKMVQDDGTRTRKGKRSRIHEPLEMMYRATLGGDWPAAEKLLDEDRTLAYRERNGNRPLHLAVALKHEKFVHKLIERMNPNDLKLTNSSGYSACCIAAISGMVEICTLLMTKNPDLVTTRHEQLNDTPLQMATISGNGKLVSFLLERTRADSLSQEEWLALLLDVIHNKMNDAALKILQNHEYLATMKNGEGLTALHVLAQQDISSEAGTGKMAILFQSIFGTTFRGRESYGKMQPGSWSVAAKLLGIIEEIMDETSAVELLQNPSILHDAAKVGNVDLIVMLALAYPDLLLQMDDDDNGYSIFHIAVKYRQHNVFCLIQQIGALKNVVVLSEDENNNNILHLAGELGPLDTQKNMSSISALQMQRELAWFKEVEAMLPLRLIVNKNANGMTPKEVFSVKHKELLKESEAWMMSTADSCMLIATIIFTVVYAAAFTVPGGNNGETGVPILLKSNWFSCFFIFEAMALFGSTLCVITFWSIKSSGFEEDRFLNILPFQLKIGLTGLFGSLIGAISAFMSAYYLVLIEGRAWLVKSLLLFIYVILNLAICSRFGGLWFKMKTSKSLPRLLSNGKGQGFFRGL